MREMGKMKVRTAGVSALAIHRWRRHRGALTRMASGSAPAFEDKRDHARQRRRRFHPFAVVMRKIVWARGQKHGGPLATARSGAMPNIGEAALRS
jgi:hypothetical protein